MNNNPYRSPESASKVERQPEKLPNNRYERASLLGLLTFLGVMILLVPFFTIATIHEKNPIHTYAWHMALVACPFGVGMAWWTWRSPKSKLPAMVVLLLLSFIVVGFLAVMILGFLADTKFVR